MGTSPGCKRGNQRGLRFNPRLHIKKKKNIFGFARGALESHDDLRLLLNLFSSAAIAIRKRDDMGMSPGCQQHKNETG